MSSPRRTSPAGRSSSPRSSSPRSRSLQKEKETVTILFPYVKQYSEDQMFFYDRRTKPRIQTDRESWWYVPLLHITRDTDESDLYELHYYDTGKSNFITQDEMLKLYDKYLTSKWHSIFTSPLNILQEDFHLTSDD